MFGMVSAERHAKVRYERDMAVDERDQHAAQIKWYEQQRDDLNLEIKELRLAVKAAAKSRETRRWAIEAAIRSHDVLGLSCPVTETADKIMKFVTDQREQLDHESQLSQRTQV
jgi:L-ribulose-5-phosphate 3-epimerase UlaE